MTNFDNALCDRRKFEMMAAALNMDPDDEGEANWVHTVLRSIEAAGYVVVPVEATEDEINAISGELPPIIHYRKGGVSLGDHYEHQEAAKRVRRAMLAAAARRG